MQKNNSVISVPSIEKFIRRTASAEKSQQKEIRITIQEARELTQELAILTANLSNIITEINKNLAEIRESSTKIDVKFDGGGF